jgi:hypothetical protein
MSWYNTDWYYTAGPDEQDDGEEEIAADEERWEYERDQELLDE